MMSKPKPVIKVEAIQQRILLIRGEKVVVYAYLSEPYGIMTKSLNHATRRNPDRFPSVFMFRLTKEKKAEVVTNFDHLQKLKFSPITPLAFTEFGALMAANVLNSSRAIEVSVFVVRAFIQLRVTLAQHKEKCMKNRRVGEKAF
ncbi:MAG: ORF6N domain-containing protein [Pseudomonadota bacterium]